MSVRFISLDPSSRLVYLMDNEQVRALPYGEAVSTPRIANHLPNPVIDTICHCLSECAKKSKAS